MRSFQSTETFDIKGRGNVYSTVADQEMDRDHADVLGQVVLIDGVPMLVMGVERTALGRPIRKGEAIGLLAQAVLGKSNG